MTALLVIVVAAIVCAMTPEALYLLAPIYVVGLLALFVFALIAMPIADKIESM